MLKPNIQVPEINILLEKFSELLHNWGFKRIHGRIWAHLYLSQNPLDAADLIEGLAISKALVSISLRELMTYDMVREVGRSPRGTRLYTANPDLRSIILNILEFRERPLISDIHSTTERFSLKAQHGTELDQISRERLARLQSSTTEVLNTLDRLRPAPPAELPPESESGEEPTSKAECPL